MINIIIYHDIHSTFWGRTLYDVLNIWKNRFFISSSIVSFFNKRNELKFEWKVRVRESREHLSTPRVEFHENYSEFEFHFVVGVEEDGEGHIKNHLTTTTNIMRRRGKCRLVNDRWSVITSSSVEWADSSVVNQRSCVEFRTIHKCRRSS